VGGVAAVVKDDNRRQRRELLRRKLDAIKHARGCARCPEDDPLCLLFHHLDPATKTMDVSRMLAGCFSWERIHDETLKCQVLCHNCHARHHGGEHAERRRRRR
jgi:hypothetical protein